MEVSNWRRDAEFMHGCLDDSLDNLLMAKEDFSIYLPRVYEGGRLALIAKEIRIVSIFMMASPSKGVYGVSKACASMQITPRSSSIIEMQGDEYYEFSFAKGDVVCPNLELVKDDTLPYSIYDQIIAKGHIPWYLDIVDLATLLDTTDFHSGLSLGPTNIPLEMIAAMIARDGKDLRKYYRHVMQQGIGFREQKELPSIIAFRNIIYGATNTTAKLLGSYFDDGLTSALVIPSEKAEGIESLLRA